MGFLEGLTIIFVALKLLGIISWSWWLVIAPMYPAIIIYLIMILFFGFSIMTIFRGFK